MAALIWLSGQTPHFGSALVSSLLDACYLFNQVLKSAAFCRLYSVKQSQLMQKCHTSLINNHKRICLAAITYYDDQAHFGVS